MKAKSGFTLVELLIVMVIVAILGVIAVPSYRSYIVGARQNSAEQALLRMAGALENCYSMNQTYVGCLGNTASAGVNDFLSANDIAAHYEYAAKTSLTARNFTVAIKAKGGQASSVDANCKVLAVDRLGRKLVSTADNTDLKVDGANNATKCWQ